MDDLPETVRVLCVDDEQAFLDLAARFLDEYDGFEVLTETDPGAALARIEAESVDCVVSDYRMPEMDGLELLDAVRDDHGDLPFVLFTGQGSEEIASEAISRGVTDYLQKGGGSDQYALLANRIRNAVERVRAGRALEASERRYRELVENSPNAVAVFRDEEIVYANDAMAELLGAGSPDRLDGLHPRENVHPDDHDELGERLERVERGETVPWTEGRVVRLDGEARHVQTRGAPVTYGGESAVQVVIVDITHRREHERRLAALGRATRAFIGAESPESVASTTVDIIEDVMDEPLAVVWRHDGDELRPVAATEAARAFDRAAESAASVGTIPEGTAEMRVFREGEVRFVESYGDLDDAAHPETPLGSLLLVPLGEYGLLNVGTPEEGEFDEGTRTMVTILARNATAALEDIDDEWSTTGVLTTLRRLGDGGAGLPADARRNI
ncbi:MAG: response regulator [Halobacteriaceae archaeon]